MVNNKVRIKSGYEKYRVQIGYDSGFRVLV